MKLTKRKGFNFFRSYYDVYNELSDADKLSFMDALLDRQFLGVNPKELKGMAKFAYISQTHSIDSQVKGYEDKTKTKLSLDPTEGGTDAPTYGGSDTPTLQVEEKGEVKEKEKEQTKDIDLIYSLYPSKTIRQGKECATKSRDKNIKKIKSLLSNPKHTVESLKLVIEAEVKSKTMVNGVPTFLKDFNTFLNNLPDIEEGPKVKGVLDGYCNEFKIIKEDFLKDKGLTEDQFYNRIDFDLNGTYKNSIQTFETLVRQKVEAYVG
mgnify:CR=1 FL=1